MKGRLASMAVLTLLAACSSSGQPTASLAPAGSAPEAAAECSPIDIRGPSGTPVDLTGVWRSNDLGIYNIRQIASCV